MSFPDVARRFGLTAERAGDSTVLRRHGDAVRFDAPLRTDDPASRHEALCACLGVRLGLDLRQLRNDERSSRSIGDLDWVQRLVPRAVTAVAARVANLDLHVEPWLQHAPFDVVFVREAGKLQILATPSDPIELHDARRALFYTAYKLRPVQKQPLAGGQLRIFETTGGIASSVATLFPDFDFDASRERGVLAVPGYNRMLVWQPGESDEQPSIVRASVRAALLDAELPFSRRLYPLTAERIVVGEVCDARRELDSACLVRNLVGVTHE